MAPQFHRNLWWLRAGIAVALVTLLYAVPVSAHPGRTDADGGHYNSDTGEYHYHHGYPAHQHYDIDGNKKPDCPYDFVDKTGSRSGSPSSSGNSGSSAKAAKESGAKVTTTQAAAEGEDREGITSAIVGWCTAGVATLAAFALWRNGEAEGKAHNEAMDGLRKTLRQETSKVEAQAELIDTFGQRGREQQAEILALKQENTAKQAELDQVKQKLNRQHTEILALKRDNATKQAESDRVNRELDRQQGRIPRDIAFAPDGMPAYWRPDSERPYGSYTVYIRRDSGIYHLDRYCAGWYPEVGHLFDVLQTPLRPCKRCAAGRLSVEEIPDWYTECWEEK